MRKLLLSVFLLVVLGLGCAPPKNFHSVYYYDREFSWHKDVDVKLYYRVWWDCTEKAIYGFKQISQTHPARMVLGIIKVQPTKYSKYSEWRGHAWVEYLVDGEIKIFDPILYRVYAIEYTPCITGKLAYNYINTEQFLRSLGYEAVVKSLIDLKNNIFIPYVEYREPYGKWIIYSGEFEDLRTEEYKWVD